MLFSVEQVSEKIKAGKPLLLAGSEEALSQLPPGPWIGCTTRYFMDETGGTRSDTKIFVDEAPLCAVKTEIREYTTADLHSVCADAPDNGYSFIIVPAESGVHAAFAQNAPNYPDAFIKTVVGWVSGAHASRSDAEHAAVFNGKSAKLSRDTAAVMHVQLPHDKLAEIEVLNVFLPGSGDVITFPNLGFSVKECSVNGRPENFADYIDRTGANCQLPLTTNHNGTFVNLSIQGVDEASKTTTFYGPVFPGLQYRFAGPVGDYVSAFDSVRVPKSNVIFSCNCILNFLYANLEGRRTGTFTGPITFGEIAHQLLNQTAVQLVLHTL